MGAVLTGRYTVKFFCDDAGVLKCKCTEQIHDEQYGWGSPKTETVDVKVFKWPGNLYALGADGVEMHWSVGSGEQHISLYSGPVIDSVTLFNANSDEIVLKRQ
jgi:hypothetical protein